MFRFFFLNIKEKLLRKMSIGKSLTRRLSNHAINVYCVLLLASNQFSNGDAIYI